jgi:gluconokinase
LTVVVLMGVTGSGKSTVGTALAARLGWPFQEGDALHSPENVAKMAAGHPLTDADRAPWLARVREWVASHEDGVITCSALKRSYRQALRDEHVVFVHLTAPQDDIATRLGTRHGHFMPAALLESQLADLEPPGDDEQPITLDGRKPVAELVDAIISRVVRP